MEEKDYRMRIVLRVRGKDEKVDVDAKLLPVRDAVGRIYGLFYIDLKSVRIEMGQDLLDDLFEVMIWFATPKRVKRAVREWFEKIA